MAELDYDALQRLVDAATPGPWGIWKGPYGSWIGAPDGNTEVVGESLHENAEFIAASRSAVPALLDRVRELTGERDAALSTIAKVEALHVPGALAECQECEGNRWPCPTVRALGSVPSIGEGNE